MAQEPLRIGLWGCGSMGHSLAQGLADTGEARLAAVYDVLPQAPSDLVSDYGASAVGSPEALLSYPGLAGVIIALPSYLHASAAVQAAKAGINVFVEKPMALNVLECREMIAAAREHSVKLMVGQVLRYYEPYRSIVRWQADGRLGAIHAASIWRIVDGRRWAVDGYWRASLAMCGGYLFEVGAHELDMLRCLMGQPQSVCATRQKFLPRQHEMEDYIALQIRFAGGQAATYEGGGGSSISRYGFRLYFEQATLLSDTAFNPAALQIYAVTGSKIESWAAELSPEHPVELELRHWLAAIREEEPVPIPGEEGLATVALIEAAYRSAQAGRIVEYTTR